MATRQDRLLPGSDFIGRAGCGGESTGWGVGGVPWRKLQRIREEGTGAQSEARWWLGTLCIMRESISSIPMCRTFLQLYGRERKCPLSYLSFHIIWQTTNKRWERDVLNPRVHWKSQSTLGGTLEGIFQLLQVQNWSFVADSLAPACAHMDQSVIRKTRLSLNLN